MGAYFPDFNLEKESFTDNRVRQALSEVIDRDTIMQGLYSPAKNLIGPGVSDVKPGSLYGGYCAMIREKSPCIKVYNEL